MQSTYITRCLLTVLRNSLLFLFGIVKKIYTIFIFTYTCFGLSQFLSYQKPKISHLEKGTLSYFTLPKTKQFWLPLFGTIVEYFDYALYGFTATIISKLFFPISDPNVTLLKTYVVFSLGSLAKPLGSLIFGWIGDKFGRKVALRWTMLGIFIPTTLIGLLPTYESWGVFSTLMLIICRLAQGIFLSGEIDGARIFLFETYLKDRPTFVNCLLGLCSFLGIFLASLSITVSSTFELESVWRYPFIIGGILGGVVFIARRYLIESTDYAKYKKNSKNATSYPQFPLKPFLGTILLCGGVGGLYQLFFVFFGTFTSNILSVNTIQQSQFLTSMMLLINIPAQLLAAWLSDNFSPKKVIYIGIFITAPLLIMLPYYLSQGTLSIFLLLSLAISLGFVFTPIFTLILPQAHVGSRYRFVSLGHAIGSLLFSGCAPAISLYFWIETNFVYVPFLHGLILCLGIFIASRLFNPVDETNESQDS